MKNDSGRTDDLRFTIYDSRLTMKQGKNIVKQTRKQGLCSSVRPPSSKLWTWCPEKRFRKSYFEPSERPDAIQNFRRPLAGRCSVDQVSKRLAGDTATTLWIGTVRRCFVYRLAGRLHCKKARPGFDAWNPAGSDSR